MGKMRWQEWAMLAVFILLLLLWIFGDQLARIHSATTALVGLGVLLMEGYSRGRRRLGYTRLVRCVSDDGQLLK